MVIIMTYDDLVHDSLGPMLPFDLHLGCVLPQTQSRSNLWSNIAWSNIVWSNHRNLNQQQSIVIPNRWTCHRCPRCGRVRSLRMRTDSRQRQRHRPGHRWGLGFGVGRGQGRWGMGEGWEWGWGGLRDGGNQGLREHRPKKRTFHRTGVVIILTG